MPLILPAPIVSTRLVLRHVEARDLPALRVVNGSDEVTRYLPYATWQTLADGEAWLARMQAAEITGTSLQLVVADRYTDVAIGACLVFRYEEGSARAEIGYVLGRAHWGAGYMREALTALVDFAFGPGGLRRLEAQVDVRNARSGRLLATLGFTVEGRLRERWEAKGETKDVDFYGLLRREWPPAQAGR